MYKNLTPPNKNKQRTVWVAVAAAAVVLGMVVLELTNVTHVFHKKQQPVTASAYTKGETSQSQNTQTGDKSSTSSNNGTQPGDQKSETGGTSNANLLTPTGDFVSNHHPNLDGNPAPNSMSSVCTTTPGANCTVRFTKDGVTKSLSSQVTDRGGSAYWNWKLQDVGLTAGTWKIEASASLNGKTVSAADAMDLVVAQ